MDRALGRVVDLSQRPGMASSSSISVDAPKTGSAGMDVPLFYGQALHPVAHRTIERDKSMRYIIVVPLWCQWGSAMDHIRPQALGRTTFTAATELERQRRDMRALRERGATDAQIAAALGVSRQRVLLILGSRPPAVAHRLAPTEPPAPLSLAQLLRGFD